MVTKQERRNKIKTRIRGKVSGTAERPRMTVFRSNKQIYVQLVDDSEGKTLASASSKGIEEGTKTEVAAKVGQAIAEKALAAGITEVVFATVICSMVELNHWLTLHATEDLNFKEHGKEKQQSKINERYRIEGPSGCHQPCH